METNQSMKSVLKLPKYSKTAWTKQEDEQLLRSIEYHGMDNWSVIAYDIPNRNGKQCRERYTNHLSPCLNHNDWSPEEDSILFHRQTLRGNQWCIISSFLPGRSPNNVKNRFNFLMSKKPSFLLFSNDLFLNSQDN
jgi:hypothetical protein